MNAYLSIKIGASSHTNKVQKWCRKNFKFFIPKEKWPPNSPELNPLDYSIWDNISNHVEYHKVKTINDLRREMEKVDSNYVREVIGGFPRRVYLVEKHGGELIIDEHS